MERGRLENAIERGIISEINSQGLPRLREAEISCLVSTVADEVEAELKREADARFNAGKMMAQDIEEFMNSKP